MGFASPGESGVPHEWLFPYLLDWNSCPKGIERMRVIVTCARWFDDPRDRLLQYSLAEARHNTDWPEWDPEHRANVLDLVGADVPIDVTLGAARLGRFFMTLRDGNLVFGGFTPERIPEPIRRLRPGYGWVLARWRAWFPDDPCPWPFWLFPVQTF